MNILVTGGAGYIGSHTVLQLLDSGHEVRVVDNLSNACLEALRRIEGLTGRAPGFVQADIRDRAALKDIFAQYPVDAVIHFAGLKAVGESVARPLRYYDNNVRGSVHLLEAMGEVGVKTLVFSSSATVYGDPHTVPITECFPLRPTNPYGRTKLMIEEILNDLQQADSSWRIALLRYFNPVGAHSSGQIGEDPHGIPSNLMPFISQVAVGLREELLVFGGDYPTVDGTGVRDYIHVEDLAAGHLKAIEYLNGLKEGELITVNLGTGRGYSVLEVVKAFEEASGKRIPYRIVDRRPGDVAACFADPGRAQRLLDWKASRRIEVMCADTWRWQSQNPAGYRG